MRSGVSFACRRTLSLASVAAILAVGLSACGDDDDGGSADQAAAGDGAAQAAGSSSAAPGVTADTVRLGIVIEKYPRDNTVPFFFRADAEKATRAIVDDINANGGAGGRKIDPVFDQLPVDLNPKTTRAMCLTLTKQENVFAGIGGYAHTSANDCLMKDAKMPWIDTAALTDQQNQRYAPNHLTASPSYSRTGKDWVYAARDLGLFDKSKGFKKLGIVSTACEADVWDNPQTGIKHWLDTVGVKSGDISEFRSDCAIEALVANHQKALLKHKQDGVTTVMIAAQPLDRNYTALAQKSGFKPKYIWGDFHWATQAANAQSLNQDAIDGSFGVTAFRQDVDAPAAKRCSDAIAKAGLPPFKEIQGDLLVMNICTALNIFKAVADKAGKDLTRRSFTTAAPTVGKIDSAVELGVDFSGDTTGGEMYQIAKWSKACTCWQPEGEPKASTYEATGA